MKRLFFISIITLFSIICNAQLGVQGGVNLAKLKIAHRGYVYTEDVSSSRTGLIGGFVFQTPIIGNLHFRPELNYIQKGGKFYILNYYQRFGTKSSVNDARFDYLQLALNTVYKIKVNKSVFFFGGGLDLGFGLGGKVKAQSTYGPSTNTPPYTLPEEYEQKASNDFGILFLSGIIFKNGLFTNLKYNLGFLNINQFSTKDDYGTITTRGFTLNAGYMISKKNKVFGQKKQRIK